MTTGSQSDMLSRLKANLPPWFGDWANAPLVSALLQGFASVWATLYTLLAYVQLQLRLATSTDTNLDIWAADFFGNGLIRFGGQSDSSYRYRIQVSMTRNACTRAAIIAAVQTVTGNAPIVTENSRPADNPCLNGDAGYGYYGVGKYSAAYPQYNDYVFVIAYRASPSNGSQDSDIYFAINAVRPVGVTVWVSIQNLN